MDVGNTNTRDSMEISRADQPSALSAAQTGKTKSGQKVEPGKATVGSVKTPHRTEGIKPSPAPKKTSKVTSPGEEMLGSHMPDEEPAPVNAEVIDNLQRTFRDEILNRPVDPIGIIDFVETRHAELKKRPENRNMSVPKAHFKSAQVGPNFNWEDQRKGDQAYGNIYGLRAFAGYALSMIPGAASEGISHGGFSDIKEQLAADENLGLQTPISLLSPILTGQIQPVLVNRANLERKGQVVYPPERAELPEMKEIQTQMKEAETEIASLYAQVAAMSPAAREYMAELNRDLASYSEDPVPQPSGGRTTSVHPDQSMEMGGRAAPTNAPAAAAIPPDEKALAERVNEICQRLNTLAEQLISRGIDEKRIGKTSFFQSLVRLARTLTVVASAYLVFSRPSKTETHPADAKHPEPYDEKIDVTQSYGYYMQLAGTAVASLVSPVAGAVDEPRKTDEAVNEAVNMLDLLREGHSIDELPALRARVAAEPNAARKLEIVDEVLDVDKFRKIIQLPKEVALEQTKTRLEFDEQVIRQNVAKVYDMGPKRYKAELEQLDLQIHDLESLPRLSGEQQVQLAALRTEHGRRAGLSVAQRTELSGLLDQIKSMKNDRSLLIRGATEKGDTMFWSQMSQSTQQKLHRNLTLNNKWATSWDTSKADLQSGPSQVSQISQGYITGLQMVVSGALFSFLWGAAWKKSAADGHPEPPALKYTASILFALAAIYVALKGNRIFISKKIGMRADYKKKEKIEHVGRKMILPAAGHVMMQSGLNLFLVPIEHAREFMLGKASGNAAAIRSKLYPAGWRDGLGDDGDVPEGAARITAVETNEQGDLVISIDEEEQQDHAGT